MRDQFGRSITYLRLSLTDRCNLRCRYCMPEEGIQKLAHAEILTFDEILRTVRALARLGVRKVRLTGGEPLVRRGIVDLAREIRAVPGVETLAITTNGVGLTELAEPLVRAGVTAFNISLDTLSAGAFEQITRRDALAQVKQGIRALEQAESLSEKGLAIKFNCVPMRGVNELELVELVRHLAGEKPYAVRFIELMPIGCARRAGLKGIPMREVRERLERFFGTLHPVARAGETDGPAVMYRADGIVGTIGFIDALEHKFCSECNRVRLTADGFLKLCLNAKTGISVKSMLRGGADGEALYHSLRRAIYEKPEEHFFAAAGDYAARDTRAMVQVGG